MLGGDAAACSRFAFLQLMSARAMKAVWAAMPPRAVLTAKPARPSNAAVNDATVPGSEVTAPSSTVPTTAAPRPVRSASRSATGVKAQPAVPITPAVATNRATLKESGSSLKSGWRKSLLRPHALCSGPTMSHEWRRERAMRPSRR